LQEHALRRLPLTNRSECMSRLEVKTNQQRFLRAVLVLLFVPLGGYLVIAGLLRMNAMPFMIGSAYLAMFAFLFWIRRRAYGRAVCYFTDTGLARNDRRHFAWSDLSRVVTQVHDGGIWRIEIHFTGGESAWLIPARVENFAEVLGFVRRLPCEHTEVPV
jgi:hypothetical protein